jgi:response regulator of citrate/malate metabolism
VIRVLVVDDDFRVARVHCAYVARVPGFEVAGEAHTGADALAAAERLRPDLVLLDIYLPDLPGTEVLHRLRTAGSAADVLVVTAANDVDTVRSAMHGGVVHYLVKPFAFDTLRERLERYAEARRRLDRLTEASQHEVDRLFGGLHAPASAAVLPKGLSPATAEQVETVLRETPADLTATEVGERVGIARVSARRYLEHLAKTGRAEVALDYGGAGRPGHRYRWAGG